MRQKLGIIGSILLLANLSACTQARPKNVVWIVIDTLRADHTGFMGYEGRVTPKLDAFSEKSLVFTQAISQSPWTKPSVATMFTSTYPHQHAALKGGDVLGDELLTIAEVLREAGYTTAAFQVNPHVTSHMNFDQGFDVHKDMSSRTRAEKVNSQIMRWLNPWLNILKPHEYFLPTFTI